MERKKGTFKKFFFSRGFLFGGLIVLFFLSVIFARAYIKNREYVQEYREEQEKLNRILNENGDLRLLLKRVQSPAYAEKIGRTNFNLVKPGENQAVLLGKNAGSGQAENDVVESIKISNPRQWWNYFFNHN